MSAWPRPCSTPLTSHWPCKDMFRRASSATRSNDPSPLPAGPQELCSTAPHN
ncbi:hypothetical protein OH76DRAFT_1400150 [Lentinus brumalis]|uniref:Uncharacterized protein n=1 Tax=Lentinus brumalis TaxID=2498619 RepID=A0A371DK59_9APHY|nr:hypothetical protein OH76DRAFT_1400150 [Polyporus brumalis]